MDINSVIHLGHTGKQPLMYRTSELVDGLEPHDHILDRTQGPRRSQLGDMGWEGVYPGWCRVGAWEGGIPVLTQPPRLRLI